jgi:AcrR family transcriptional regulator
VQLGQRTKSAHNNTARRILEHARRAFNERGVANVGIREIARELGLSPGNVSYHFATKEALIRSLFEAQHAENNATVAGPLGPLDFGKVASIIRAIMERDLEHRWMMRESVGLLLTMPTLRTSHAEMQRAREGRVDSVAARLVEAGLLDKTKTARALPLLRQQVLTQVFFWIPAAILAALDRDPAERLELHLRAALALFLPYCTSTGRRQLQRLLARSQPA